MNKSSRSLIAAALLASVLMGCGKGESPGPTAKTEPKGEAASKGHAHGGNAKPGDHGEAAVVKLTEAEVRDAGIRTETVSEDAVRARFSVSATIEPNRDRFAHVAPRVPGRIVRVPAKAGDLVREGQTLAELDSVELGEAHSMWLQAASHEALAKADFDRADRLFKEQVVPEKDHLRARSEYEKARAAAQAASDKLRMMGVTPSRSVSGHSTFPVTAPFPGTVVQKDAVIGELAQPDKSLFSIADLSTVWIEANLAEGDLTRVTPGALAEVVVQAYPEERFRGKVAYVGGILDKESRTVKARVEVPNRDGRLKPGMFATAYLDAEVRGKGIAVPSDAIVLMDGKKAVFVKEVDGFEARSLDLGEDVGGRQIVKGGLYPGDQVVVAGAYALKARVQKSKIGEGHAH